MMSGHAIFERRPPILLMRRIAWRDGGQPLPLGSRLLRSALCSRCRTTFFLDAAKLTSFDPIGERDTFLDAAKLTSFDPIGERDTAVLLERFAAARRLAFGSWMRLPPRSCGRVLHPSRLSHWHTSRDPMMQVSCHGLGLGSRVASLFVRHAAPPMSPGRGVRERSSSCSKRERRTQRCLSLGAPIGSRHARRVHILPAFDTAVRLCTRIRRAVAGLRGRIPPEADTRSRCLDNMRRRHSVEVRARQTRTPRS